MLDNTAAVVMHTINRQCSFLYLTIMVGGGRRAWSMTDRGFTVGYTYIRRTAEGSKKPRAHMNNGMKKILKNNAESRG